MPSSTSKPLIIAHRGASAYAPENTMAAFRKARELEADAIELDVQQTSDGHIVVIHDETLRRTTRSPGRVGTKTLAELQTLDAGRWFAKQFTEESIPELSDVLSWARSPLKVWIEIKEADPLRVLKIVETTKMRENIVLFSLNIEIMEVLADSSVERSLVFPKYTRKTPTLRSLCDLADALNLTSVAPHYSLVTKRTVEYLHQEHLGVAVWTANRPGTIRRLLRDGVDAIITNYPDRANRILLGTKSFRHLPR